LTKEIDIPKIYELNYRISNTNLMQLDERLHRIIKSMDSSVFIGVYPQSIILEI